jgi:type IV fimbrial biogenesis protein FimT
MVCKRKQAGFTLQELLIGIAIFLILAGAGVPSFINYARNGSRDNTTTDLFADMYYARSEAIKRKTKVYLCRSANPNATPPACGGTAQDWSTGWMVFADKNSNGVYDNGTDPLLKVGTPANNRIHIKSNAKANAMIAYNTDGSLDTNFATAVFAICDDRDNDGNDDAAYGEDITVGAMGRPEITKPTPNCAP